MTIRKGGATCPFESAANVIYQSLQPGSIDQSTAEWHLRDLHEKGVMLVKSLRSDETTIVPSNLNGVLHVLTQISVAHFQGNRSLECAFAKTVHILSEVSFWYADTEGLPMPETVESVKRVANALLETTSHRPWMLPSDRVPASAVVLHFHANSLLQLSRCLTENPGKLSLFVTAAQLIAPLATTDVGAAFGNLATTIPQTMDALVNEWVVNTLALRWNALTVDNLDDFDQFITSYIEKYAQRGGEYTVCLAMVLMDLIVEENRTNDVRSLALLMLLSLTTKTSSGLKDKMCHFQDEIMSRIEGLSDRFDATRKVVRAFLSALSISTEFRDLIHNKLVMSSRETQAANRQEELEQLNAVIIGIENAIQKGTEKYNTTMHQYETMRAHLQRSALRGSQDSEDKPTMEELLQAEREMQAELTRIAPDLEECKRTMQNEFDEHWQELGQLFTNDELTAEKGTT